MSYLFKNTGKRSLIVVNNWKCTEIELINLTSLRIYDEAV